MYVYARVYATRVCAGIICHHEIARCLGHGQSDRSIKKCHCYNLHISRTITSTERLFCTDKTNSNKNAMLKENPFYI